MSGHRIGSGFDIHRLVPGRKLRLGGVEVPFEKGLEGHSDGDCLVHAVCDALLGAAALGDMGRYFPSDDPRHQGRDSLEFLDEVAKLLEERGFGIVNVDATVIAQAPRLAPHQEAFRRNLAGRLQLDLDAVSVKAKSSDGLGATGRGDAIAALATVLIEWRP